MEKIINKAWKNYTNNIFSLIGGFVLSFLIPLAVTGVVAIISFSPLIYAAFASGFSGAIELAKSNILVYLIVPLIVTGIVFILIFSPFYFGFVHMVVTGSKRKNVKLAVLFEGIKKFWKKAIVQQLLYLLLITVISLPFVKIGFDMFPLLTTNKSTSVFLGAFSILISWIAILILIGFFLLYWIPAIVIYDKGVIESAKISLIKVRKNLLETFVVYLLIILISAIAGVLENIVPLIPSIVLTPLSVSILVEACKELK